MKYKNISKREIKSYIKWIEKELDRKSKEIIQMQNENEEAKMQLYDLTDSYLIEENLNGQLKAAKYILNNCYGEENKIC